MQKMNGSRTRRSRYLRTAVSSLPAIRRINSAVSSNREHIRSPVAMTLVSRNAWEAAAGVTLVAGLAVGAVLYLRRKRPTEEELERARRKMLALSGRLIDGMLLDVREITLEDGRSLTLARIQLPQRRRGLRMFTGHHYPADSGRSGPDACRLSLHCPLPARKSAEQHCDLGIMVRSAIEPSGFPPDRSLRNQGI